MSGRRRIKNRMRGRGGAAGNQLRRGWRLRGLPSEGRDAPWFLLIAGRAFSHPVITVFFGGGYTSELRRNGESRI